MSPFIEYESPLSLMVGKLCTALKFFLMNVKGCGQGHVIKIYSTIRKVLS